METLYDMMSVTLFIAAAGIFFYRFRSENPPLAPYILISLVCAVSNWLGNNGGGVGAVLLLIAGSFYLLHIASAPFAEEEGDPR
ncbi:MAG: XrtV sorting system accessory protein [Pseudomonadota bacterium]